MRKLPQGLLHHCAAMLALLVLCTPTTAIAADLDLLSISALVRVGEKRVIGKVQPESFRAYDVMATFRLPEEYQIPTDLGLETRLLVSAGILQAAGQTAMVASLIPDLAIATQDRRFSADVGAGLALMSRSRFGQQDFGGPLQFALTAGASIPLFGQFGLGYRFMHYSDSGLYSPSTIGADFHMLELLYRF